MALLKAIPKSYEDLLLREAPCLCATTKSSGLLSVHPVSALWEDGRLFFSTIKTRGKYRNLLRDNRVSLCFLDPENPVRYIEIRGRAILTDDPDRIVINKMAKHHMGVDEYPYDPPGTERATVTIDVREVWVQP